LRFSALDALQLGPSLAAEFARRWPDYQAWFRRGHHIRPDYRVGRMMLARYMPELIALYDKLLILLDADEEQARFLCLWCPPDFMHGCTQVIWRRHPGALIRNYDYPPGACDALLLRSAWFGSSVLAMSDCLWGVLDGMNASGLAVSLSFGGRAAVGPGFGIALILRYLLETCRSAREALAVLQRIPVHLSYNIALLDRSGQWLTVAIGPDRPPEIRREPYSANRQHQHDDPRFSDSVDREAALSAYLDGERPTEAGLIRQFLRPPLHRPVIAREGGTLYTAAYRPAENFMELYWPWQHWRQSLTEFAPGERIISYI